MVYSRSIGRHVLAPIAGWGYRRYQRTGTTPRFAYSAMRKLRGCEDSGPFDRLVAQARREHQLLDLPDEPVGLAAGHLGEVVDGLRRDGDVVLPELLDTATCDGLDAVARRHQATLVGGESAGTGLWDPDRPQARRYDLAESDLVADPAVQRIVADPSLLAVAQRYLGAAPVQDLVAMWWSAVATDDEAQADAAAQRFHFDLDRLAFLKVFVYLTDVDHDTGPHVFVAGSHQELPLDLRRDGRHDDEVVSAALPGRTVEIAGPRGTVFLADTAGLHKGLPLRRDHRLVFQTEYAVSLFGAPYTSPLVAGDGPLAEAAMEYPSVFRRFYFTPGDEVGC